MQMKPSERDVEMAAEFCDRANIVDRKDIALLLAKLRQEERNNLKLIPPHDGGPKLRPHTIKGWWQVWSGGICIALLTPEDVAVLR